eukprot:TRINITY_DN1133_c1_g1_i1.p1 TRINITY_DN1133_c1_g1~~TRINITY_DN1133_c1_g1_i1.p1  ORF type:complete len:240 (+),score=41.33 TRINITY_DN1133_c1_g1_i1:55-720(+)
MLIQHCNLCGMELEAQPHKCGQCSGNMCRKCHEKVGSADEVWERLRKAEDELEKERGVVAEVKVAHNAKTAILMRQLEENLRLLQENTEMLSKAQDTSSTPVKLSERETIIPDSDQGSTLRKNAFEKGDHHQSRCTLCATKYTLLKREHHCRSCYLSICGDCSGIKAKDKRYCDFCLVSRALVSPCWGTVLPANPPSLIDRLHSVATSIKETHVKQDSHAG